jgi:uncharacterized protein (DUF2147 family)
MFTTIKNTKTMKKLPLIFVFLMVSSLQLFAQADQVIGFWLTDSNESQVEIYKTSNGTYEGKIVWLKEPLDENRMPKTDNKNPDTKLRNRPVEGVIILKDFTYDASSKEWKGGTIYDPKNGKTYDAYMWFDNNNTLSIKGFVLGMRFIGRSTIWIRERQKRN